MGACSSKPATDEEKQFICKAMGQEMLVLCVDDALTKENANLIKIEAPPQLQSIKASSAKLKELGKDPSNVVEREGAEEAKASEGGGGFFAGMLNKAVDAMTGVAEFAAGMTAEAMSQAFTKTAEMLDKCVEQVETPMTTIGKDLVSDDIEQLSALLKDFIKHAQVPNAVTLCMGDEKDALSKHIITEASAGVSDKLKPVVGPKVTQHKAIKAWKTLIDSYNQFCDQVKKFNLGDDFSPKPIELDIHDYICKSCAEQIGLLMAKSEGTLREKPGNKGAFPDIFEKVFKNPKTEKDDLLEKDYQSITKAEKK